MFATEDCAFGRAAKHGPDAIPTDSHVPLFSSATAQNASGCGLLRSVWPAALGATRWAPEMCSKAVSKEIWTMAVPVPCRFAELLKLLSSTLFATNAPAVTGTTATPYGFTSPLAGTAEATVLTWCSALRNEGPLATAGAANRNTDPTISRKRVRVLSNSPLFTGYGHLRNDGMFQVVNSS
jgi:hypothetical protein